MSALPILGKRFHKELKQEKTKFYDELDEPTILAKFSGLFPGQSSYLMVIINLITLIFFASFLYCIINYFGTKEITELIKWSFGTMIFLIGMRMLKLYAWMQMVKNALLRKPKRLELQVFYLAGKI